MKRTAILLLMFSMLYAADAQNIGTQQMGAVTLRDLFDPNYSNAATYDGKYKKIDGSPYWDDEFLNGDIILKDGTVFEDVPLKLDLYENKLIVRHEGSETIVKKAVVDQFRISVTTFINAVGFGYIEEIRTGPKVNLYRKVIIEYEEGEVATGYNAGQTDPKFNRDEELLIMNPVDREIIALPRRKKERYNVLGNYTEIDLKSTRLNPRKVDELAEIVDLIND